MPLQIVGDADGQMDVRLRKDARCCLELIASCSDSVQIIDTADGDSVRTRQRVRETYLYVSSGWTLNE